MVPVADTASGTAFLGSVDDETDLAEAAAIARGCKGYIRDDDDECYVEGDGPTCFNCRARRWTHDGFTCTKGLLGRMTPDTGDE